MGNEKGFEVLEVLIVMFFIFLAIVMVMLGLAVWLDENTCMKKYHNFNPTWGIFQGCQIEVDGKRIPTDNWRDMN